MTPTTNGAEANKNAPRDSRIWAAGKVLHEVHGAGCCCSYCGNGYDAEMRFGLNIPPAWRRNNSWWVIKYWSRHYLRWTWPGFLFRE